MACIKLELYKDEIVNNFYSIKIFSLATLLKTPLSAQGPKILLETRGGTKE